MAEKHKLQIMGAVPYDKAYDGVRFQCKNQTCDWVLVVRRDVLKKAFVNSGPLAEFKFGIRDMLCPPPSMSAVLSRGVRI